MLTKNLALLVGLFTTFSLCAQPPAVERPKVLGVAHVALYIKDLAKTRQFYENFLGYGEPFTLPNKSGDGVRIAFVKINDRQYLELFNESDRGEGQLNHISIYTDNADRMRDYLASKNVAVPAKVGKGQTGNKNFNIKDPDGHIVEVVEYQPASWTTRENGKSMPSSRISSQIMHAGFLAGDLEKSTAFYCGILGFKEFWRGSSNGRQLSWVNLRVPDGDDYIELMLYDKLPEPGGRGTKNHISLMVADAQKAVDELQKRAARGLYEKEIKIQTGVNRKRQINLYDPDGTRVELMEPNTIDGKPAQSSTAPPPQPSAN
jgi:lactoylglutathione lyase